MYSGSVSSVHFSVTSRRISSFPTPVFSYIIAFQVPNDASRIPQSEIAAFPSTFSFIAFLPFPAFCHSVFPCSLTYHTRSASSPSYAVISSAYTCAILLCSSLTCSFSAPITTFGALSGTTVKVFSTVFVQSLSSFAYILYVIAVSSLFFVRNSSFTLVKSLLLPLSAMALVLMSDEFLSKFFPPFVSYVRRTRSPPPFFSISIQSSLSGCCGFVAISAIIVCFLFCF